jgi:hypothetical protein
MKRVVDAVVLFLLAAIFASFAQAEAAEGEGEDAFVLIGVVQGIGDEALTIMDGIGDTYRFDFTENFSRVDIPTDVGIGRIAVAIFYGGFEGVNEVSGDLIDLYLAQTMVGILAGVDGEAITVQVSGGGMYTFFFDPTFPRSALDDSFDMDVAILVAYEGEFDEYGQFTGTFAVFHDPTDLTVQAYAKSKI